MYIYPKTIALHEAFQEQYAQNLGDPLPNPQWEIDKRKLIADNRDDEFYVQVSMKTHKILWHHNMDKWLGYKVEQVLEESFFDNIVHPFILPYYNAFALGVFWLIREKKDVISKMRYKVTIPMRNVDGEYTCIQQISYPCEFDSKGQPVTYFMRFIHQSVYDGQSLRPTIMEDNNEVNELKILWYKLTAQLLPFEDEKQMFTRDELKVLKEAYKVRFEDKRNDLLQQKLLMSIKHHNAAIKAKTKSMFISPLDNIPKPTPLSNFYTCLPKLNDVYQISEFLHHSDMIQIIEDRLRLP
jgi:hypothetical protein